MKYKSFLAAADLPAHFLFEEKWNIYLKDYSQPLFRTIRIIQRDLYNIYEHAMCPRSYEWKELLAEGDILVSFG